MSKYELDTPLELAGRVCTVKVALHGHFHITSLYPTVGLQGQARIDEMELIMRHLSQVPEPHVVATGFQEELSLEYIHRWAAELNMIPIHTVEPTCMGSCLDGFFVTKALAAREEWRWLNPGPSQLHTRASNSGGLPAFESRRSECIVLTPDCHPNSPSRRSS
eukprot:2482828-Amphidinium_carterae.2